ncbi:Putative YbaK/ebsC family protein [Clostridium chauvoei JF4335]|uniref:Cys-tRNA(Pro)/Cys-tRNA(Cys) deacylase n=2 Tax=Clostridium chauvoei TaxID=46867 RepID=S6FPF2_9CLOT|nr:aminoacyl-tRNA deacylase [Clostridium chauvoei]ATD56437.1 aminoacyl-tRNA deacylase [Clostridium chauvoei]CDG02619.1 Putative YbaK/ebsC family protein [Clostridium chauvoei JF4335]SLK22063.1 Putative YbaK/ebsC family protein [Clostridium chauvoei JF4335]
MAQVKTNAMRILDKNKSIYDVITYDIKDGRIDGVSVAEKINKPVQEVYKTLVTIGNSKEIYVFVIPVNEELDLKKSAKIVSEKKIDMIQVKDIQKYTGYIRGGCSPLGMKKQYKTFIDSTAKELDKIIVSGGKIGIQIEMNPNNLTDILNAQFENIIK